MYISQVNVLNSEFVHFMRTVTLINAVALHIAYEFQKFEKLIVEIILFSVHYEHLT